MPNTFPAPMTAWTPPEDWPTITAIDAHTEGEPLRVVVSGYPALAGAGKVFGIERVD